MAKEDEISSDKTKPKHWMDESPSEPNITSRTNEIRSIKSDKSIDIKALKADYTKKGMDKIPDTFVLYRIIGNDLFPRHKIGQALENLQFVLQNEPDLELCEKRWVINRIINKETEQALIELLRQHNQPFIHIPFREEEYKVIGWDMECLPETSYLTDGILDKFPRRRKKLLAAIYRLKNNYVMNNNGARNVALSDGKPRAKWILPWDGNCFVSSRAWKQIVADVTASPYLKYFTVPMARVVSNELLLSDEFTPDPSDEPQLIFRTDTAEEFNEDFCYGRRSKVELFWRLGMPGYWDQWKNDPWDLARPTESSEAYEFGTAGWVARMYSGMKTLEQNSSQRGAARLDAIIGVLRHLDILFSGRSADENELLTYRIDVLRQERDEYLAGKPLPPIDQLIEDADAALTDESTLLQNAFENSITLALAWFFTGKRKYAEHGARILNKLFVNKDTKMPSQLKYAYNRSGQNIDNGHSLEIIGMKDIYYYLDAVRLFKSAGTVSEDTFLIFKEWLRTYLDWLCHSEQGKNESKSSNYHGTCYDLQIAAIADFLGDHSLLYDTLIRAQSRIKQQFAEDGSQQEGSLQTNIAHYCLFNLQAWIQIAEIAFRWGMNLWTYEASNGVSLMKAVQWLHSRVEKDWSYQQMELVELERYFPIWFTIPQDIINLPSSVKIPTSKYMVRSRYISDYGVRPYWNLGLGN